MHAWFIVAGQCIDKWYDSIWWGNLRSVVEISVAGENLIRQAPEHIQRQQLYMTEMLMGH